MFKRIAALMLAVAFIALTVAPDALACNRRRSRANASYNGYRYNNYNAYRYNNYNAYRNNTYGSYGYNTYNPYRYNGVASDRYYYRGRRNGVGSTGRALLTVGAPAAIGAGVGALLNGKKGAVVGALLGGGGGAAYYLLRNRGRR